MPYVKRVVIAGCVRETRKMYTSRYHAIGMPRAKNENKTPEAQHRVNERLAEDKLRWKLNANFAAGDLHVVLHYYSRPKDLESAERDKRAFLRVLRQVSKKRGVPWKYVAATETRHSPHHHIILPDMPLKDVAAAWERVTGPDQGNISVKPLDRRGDHRKLAHYLIKETSGTVIKYRELGLRYKRFTSARGMVTPEPKYTVISASRWAQEPRPSKGWTIIKTDTGASCRTGVHDVTGWPWQEYTELMVGPQGPPIREEEDL